MYLTFPVWTNFTVSLTGEEDQDTSEHDTTSLERHVTWQHPLIFIFPTEINLALFLLRPLSAVAADG